MKVAVVGATGLVGSKMLQVLQERSFPVTELLPVASERSWGKKVTFQGKQWTVMSADDAIARRPALAIFSAGGAVSAQLAPRFAEIGCYVVDNSSYWRMDPSVPLIVPEINADALRKDAYIIANPNCSTIQMVLPLAPLHKAYGIKRIVVSTYQSVTGAGQRGIEQLEAERAGGSGTKFPHRIDLNILPHIDSFLPDGYTKEEMKMVNETRKILRDESIAVSATTVRVPVKGGHSESVNIEFSRPFDLADARKLMADMPGVVIQDDPSQNLYPMPITAWEKDEVFVGRIRRDPSVENGLNLWCVSDNIRKGAATNAVQIAQVLLQNGWLE
jgi:aspartate-semialdehyde dehydrogenase